MNHPLNTKEMQEKLSFYRKNLQYELDFFDQLYDKIKLMDPITIWCVDQTEEDCMGMVKNSRKIYFRKKENAEIYAKSWNEIFSITGVIDKKGSIYQVVFHNKLSLNFIRLED